MTEIPPGILVALVSLVAAIFAFAAGHILGCEYGIRWERDRRRMIDEERMEREYWDMIRRKTTYKEGEE